MREKHKKIKKLITYTGAMVGAGPATVARLGNGSKGQATWTSLREKVAGNLILPVNGLGTGTTCNVA